MWTLPLTSSLVVMNIILSAAQTLKFTSASLSRHSNTVAFATRRSSSSQVRTQASTRNLRSRAAASTLTHISSATTRPLAFQHFSTLTDPAIAMTTTIDVEKEYPLQMTDDERYLFDLNGFVIIRNVLTPDEIAAANAAIDRKQSGMIERSEDTPALRNAMKGTSFYGNGTGRKDLGGVLEWELEDSEVFKSILAHPRLVPLFHGILGKGYRMDHLPFVIAQDQGAEGFALHGGTIDCNSGEYNPELAYTTHNGFIRSALLGCNVMLTDHDEGYGGFCVVPGSHKSNFKMPDGMVNGEKYKEFIIQPKTKAGDVVLFSEGTVHGAMAWTPETQRRVCLYRFGPATNVYGRSYFNEQTGQTMWPDKMYEGLNDAQKAVLEPPYANRLDRPEIVLERGSDGKVVAEKVTYSSRNERKKQHDQQLFGTKYF
mmetsp:Transcript_3012/g.4253  ORF Transcript_3012/g.4253 Transcript_3012/m.4253 type:complete len:428 (-) Transcript_3012:15-1298(-)